MQKSFRENFDEVRNWLAMKIAPITPSFNFTNSINTSSVGLFDRQGDVNEMYNSFKGIVFALINARAKEVSRLMGQNVLQCYQHKNNDEFQLLPIEHPLSQLIRNPNPYLSQYDFWYAVQTSKDLTGNAYCWIGRDKLNVPRELWLLPSNTVRIIAGDMRKGEPVIKSYLVQFAGSDSITIPSEDILHLRLVNPESPYYYGMSLVMKAATEIDIDNFIAQHQRTFFKNDAVPPAVITFKNNLNADARKAFEENWIRRYKMQAGKMGYLEGDATIQTLFNSKELDYLSSIPILRQRIQAVFGVPDSKLMLSETITARSTLETIDYNFLKETIEPEIVKYAGQLTNDLAQYFNPSFVVKAENVVPRDLMQQIDIDTKQLNAGLTSINEIRLRDGLDALKGGDEPLISFNVVPLSEVGAKINSDASQKSITKKVKEYSETEKLAIWKQHDRKQMKWERVLSKQLKVYFNSMREDVLKNLHGTKSLKKDIGLSSSDLQKYIHKLSSLMDKQAGQILEEAFNEFINTYEIDGVVYSPSSPKIKEVIAKLVERTKSVPQSVKDELETTLSEGIRLNEDVTQLSQRVNEFFSNTTDYRALRIARTTSNSCLNEANNIAAKESGVFDKKMWITQRDSRVRNSHWEVDGKKVGIDEKFLVIDENTGTHSNMNGAGDITALPEFVINCRCTTFYLQA